MCVHDRWALTPPRAWPIRVMSQRGPAGPHPPRHIRIPASRARRRHGSADSEVGPDHRGDVRAHRRAVSRRISVRDGHAAAGPGLLSPVVTLDSRRSSVKCKSGPEERTE